MFTTRPRIDWDAPLHEYILTVQLRIELSLAAGVDSAYLIDVLAGCCAAVPVGGVQ